MPKSPTPALTFYPAYCFSASPTFNTWVKLSAAGVHSLNERQGFEGQRIYFHLNHPIKWVRLVGVIVAFDQYPNRWVLQLDDSSGAIIELFCRRNAPPAMNATDAKSIKVQNLLTGKTVSGNDIDLSGIDIGSVVKVKGGIGEFRGEKQITLERINTIMTTTEEATAWTELYEFQSSVLSKPWVIEPEDQKALKEEADGTKRRAEEKQRRKKRREMRAEEEKKKKQKRKGKETTIGDAKHKRRTSDKENHEIDEGSIAPRKHHRREGK